MEKSSIMSPGAQFTKFCAVGALATVLQYSVLVAMVRMFGTDPILASSIGFVASAVVNYQLNYHFTFRSDRSHAQASIRFAAIALMGLGLNTAIMHIGTAIMGIHYFGVQVATTIVVLGWTFFANRRWSYAPAPGAETEPTRSRLP